MCTWVKAIENARAAALPSRYLRASAERGGAIRRDAGGERHAHEGARRQPHALAQRGDRIEHRAGRAGQRAAVERERVGERAAAAEEPRAIGLPLDGAAEAGHRRRARGTPTTGASSAARGRRLNSRPALCAIELGLDEQLAERRVREVVLGTRQHDLGVAGDLDLARPVAAVGDRQPPHLDVVLGRDGDLELRLEVAVAPAERDLVEIEGRLVAGPAPGRPAGRWATRLGPTTDRAGR